MSRLYGPSVSVRLPNALLDRLNDAAARHNLTAAETVRRAVRRYAKEVSARVVDLPNREETTRANSTVVKFAGTNATNYLPLLGQIITWFLDHYDTGKDHRVDIAELHRLNGLPIPNHTVAK